VSFLNNHAPIDDNLKKKEKPARIYIHVYDSRSSIHLGNTQLYQKRMVAQTLNRAYTLAKFSATKAKLTPTGYVTTLRMRKVRFLLRSTYS
jgi:hypothetical protein